MKYSIKAAALCLGLLSLAPVSGFAQVAPPSKTLVDNAVIKDIRAFVDTEIVRQSTLNQNKKYAGLTPDKVQSLDQQWRVETESPDQPLISATLSNPLSSYLTRVQARAMGLYTEMFVMDENGLNVGQSNITSDYWQADEEKFSKTFLEAPGTVFIDEPEYDKDMGVWRIQVNLAITDEANAKNIGAITVELNLSELQRRKMNTYYN